jgi:hypothetical protein
MWFDPACRLLADSVAKVGVVHRQRNVHSIEAKFLNLSVLLIVIHESILRASEPKRLLQQYRHICDIRSSDDDVSFALLSGSSRSG